MGERWESGRREVGERWGRGGGEESDSQTCMHQAKYITRSNTYKCTGSPAALPFANFNPLVLDQF